MEWGDEVDRRPGACVCVCLLYVPSTVCERRSVDANATLVGGWLFRRPVIYRLSCAQNSLPFPLSLSRSLPLSSSPPLVLQSEQTRRIFEPWGPTLPGLCALESSIFFTLFVFLYVPLLGAGFRRSRTNVVSVLVFTRIIHNV